MSYLSFLELTPPSSTHPSGTLKISPFPIHLNSGRIYWGSLHDPSSIVA